MGFNLKEATTGDGWTIETGSMPLRIMPIVELCRYWQAVKRLSDEWKDTIITPLSDEQQNFYRKNSVIQLSPRKLCSIRKATGGETRVAVAE